MENLIKMLDLIYYKTNLKEDLYKLELGIKKSKHLKNVFNLKWFKTIEKEIENLQDIPYNTKSFFAFTSFLFDQLNLDSLNIVKELDKYFGFVIKNVKKNQIKPVKDKLRRIGNGDAGNFFGSVYENIIIGKFFENNIITVYEPPIPNTESFFDAKVNVSNENVFVEITSFHPLKPVIYNENRFLSRIINKLKKINSINIPLIIFYNINAYDVRPNILHDGIYKLKNSELSKYLSVLIISNDYRAKDNFIWINKNANFKVCDVALLEVKKIFNTKDFSPWEFD